MNPNKPTNQQRIVRLQSLAQKRIQSLIFLCKKSPALKKLFPINDIQIGCIILNSRDMRKLKFRFFGKKETTDVLSFPTPTVFRKKGNLGDIAICFEVLIHQSQEAQHTIKKELDVLLVHGLLHLLDFDHENTADKKRMQFWEQKLLNQLWLIERSASPLNQGLIKRQQFATVQE